MARDAIIQGHPDPAGHYGHALADAYAHGAVTAGNEVRRVEVARLGFPVLRTESEFEQAAPVPHIRDAQDTILWADHLVILYPLWLGAAPVGALTPRRVRSGDPTKTVLPSHQLP